MVSTLSPPSKKQKKTKEKLNNYITTINFTNHKNLGFQPQHLALDTNIASQQNEASLFKAITLWALY